MLARNLRSPGRCDGVVAVDPSGHRARHAGGSAPRAESLPEASGVAEGSP